MSAAEKQRRQYLVTQITTASKEQLVVMLFDGLLRFVETARIAYSANPAQIENGGNAIQRAQAIVMELLYTLDREKGGQIAENLANLHAYAFKCLVHAQMQRDLSKLQEVVRIYNELREAWVGAMNDLGLTSGVASAPAPASPPASPTVTAPAVKPGPAPKPPAAPAKPVSAPAAPASKATPAPASAPARPAASSNPGRYAVNPAALAAAAAKRSAGPDPATPAAPAATPATPVPMKINPAALAAALAARAAREASAASSPSAPVSMPAAPSMDAVFARAFAPADVAAEPPGPAPNAVEAGSGPERGDAPDSVPSAGSPGPAAAPSLAAAGANQYARRVAMLAASVKRSAAFNAAADPSSELPSRGAHAQAMAAYGRKLA